MKVVSFLWIPKSGAQPTDVKKYWDSNLYKTFDEAPSFLNDLVVELYSFVCGRILRIGGCWVYLHAMHHDNVVDTHCSDPICIVLPIFFMWFKAFLIIF